MKEEQIKQDLKNFLNDLELFEAIDKGEIISYDKYLEERQAIDNLRI